MSTELTVDEIRSALPTGLRGMATQEFADKVNGIVQDPDIAENVRNNFMTYARVLSEGKFKTEEYLNAVMYVSYKLMDKTNQDAWKLTFPKRHSDLVARGADARTISSHVAAYAKTKLVNLILEQAYIPTWVLNQDLFQKALNTQADLMVNAQSEKVRCDAANSILTHLQKPKETGPLINIGVSDGAGLAELRGEISRLAVIQQQSIRGGISPKDIAGQSLFIEGESTRVG